MIDPPARFGLGALALLASLCLFGCGAEPTAFGRAGDAVPLTGMDRTREVAGLVPSWRRALYQPDIFRAVRHQFGGVAHDPANDRVAVVTADGVLYCLRASNGDLIWRTTLGGGGGGRAWFRGDRLFLGTDDGRMLALRPDNGRKIWSYSVQGAITRGPVFSGESMYFVDGDNAVYALKHATGEWQWQYRRQAPAEFALQGEARPTVADGRVHVGFSDGYLVTLNAKDGAVLWARDLAPEHERFQDVDAPAAVINGRLYAASSAAGIYALDPQTGDILWSTPISGTVQLIGYEEDIVVGLDEGQVLRLRGIDGFVMWRTRFGRASGAPGEPVLLGDDVLVAFTKGGLHTLSVNDGRPKNHFTPGNGIHAPITVGRDGQVFFISDGGVVYAMNRFDKATPSPCRRPPSRSALPTLPCPRGL